MCARRLSVLTPTLLLLFYTIKDIIMDSRFVLAFLSLFPTFKSKAIHKLTYTRFLHSLFFLIAELIQCFFNEAPVVFMFFKYNTTIQIIAFLPPNIYNN